MGPLEFIAIFGGLFHWPIFMVFHRRWSVKAKLLSVVFFGTLAAVFGFGGWFIFMLNHGHSIHYLWPFQFVFPIITISSFVASFTVTFVFDDEGDV